MILFDNRWVGLHGIGRFTSEVVKRLSEIKQIDSSIKPLGLLDPFYLTLLIKQLKPSVFYSPGFNPPLYSCCPFVLTIHDLNYIQFSGNSNFLKQAYYNFYLKLACHHAFKVITVSEFSRQSIIKWSGGSEDKVVNIGNGVSEEYCPEGKAHSPGYQYIFCVGSDKPHKNLSGLLDGFKHPYVRGWQN